MHSHMEDMANEMARHGHSAYHREHPKAGQKHYPATGTPGQVPTPPDTDGDQFYPETTPTSGGTM
jgi:hypothetical protein